MKKFILLLAFLFIAEASFASWTAELISKERIEGDAVLVVRYTNGETDIQRTYRIASPGDDFLKSIVRQEIRNLEALDAYVDSLSLGAINTTVDPKTQEQTDADKFFENYNKYISVKKAISDGLVAQDSEDFLALKATIESTFKTEYTKDFRWQQK